MENEPYWKRFLAEYADQGAHFHGEAIPSELPDLILEVRPTPESQDWLWVYRPNGTEPTDAVKDEMCQEMLIKLQNIS